MTYNHSEEIKRKISKAKLELYKNNSKIVYCLNCNKQYKVPLSRYNNGRGRYCSRLCQSIDKKGVRYSIDTEFKKGQIAWNKGLQDENSHLWKSDKVGNRPLHKWVEKHLGKPSICEHCGSTNAKRYEWSNISRTYKRELSDWQRLCSKCHQDYDGHSIVNNKAKLNEL